MFLPLIICYGKTYVEPGLQAYDSLSRNSVPYRAFFARHKARCGLSEARAAVLPTPLEGGRGVILRPGAHTTALDAAGCLFMRRRIISVQCGKLARVGRAPGVTLSESGAFPVLPPGVQAIVFRGPFDGSRTP